MKLWPLYTLGFVALAGGCKGSYPQPSPENKIVRTTESDPAAWPTQMIGERGPGVPDFWVRPGYRVDLVSETMPEARLFCFDDRNRVLAAAPNEGEIHTYTLDEDGKYKKTNVFAKDVPTAHGLCFRDGWLWFAQSGAVWRARDDNGDGKADQAVQVLKNLPSGGGHWWRSVLVDKGYIWTGIGDPENITDWQQPTERTWLFRFNLDGSGKTPICYGLRNTEKILFRPGTNDLYGCDQGSDFFGKKLGDTGQFNPVTDWNPPDEFNKLVTGAFYGHPYITGNRVPRYEFQKRRDILDLAAKTTPPAWCFDAHVAAVGFCFIEKGAKLPEEMQNDALVAEHGSYNRRIKVGYGIYHLLFDKATGEPYACMKLVGTLAKDGDTVLGRPVDVAQGPDGNFYFTSQSDRRLYKLSYVGGNEKPATP